MKPTPPWPILLQLQQAMLRSLLPLNLLSTKQPFYCKIQSLKRLFWAPLLVMKIMYRQALRFCRHRRSTPYFFLSQLQIMQILQRKIPPILFIPLGPLAVPKAFCMPIAPHGGVDRCLRIGQVCDQKMLCFMLAQSIGPIRSAWAWSILYLSALLRSSIMVSQIRQSGRVLLSAMTFLFLPQCQACFGKYSNMAR